jgi:hypothetical protein
MQQTEVINQDYFLCSVVIGKHGDIPVFALGIRPLLGSKPYTTKLPQPVHYKHAV